MSVPDVKRRLLIVNGNQFGYSAGHYYYCKYLRKHFDIHFICFDRGLPKIDLDEIKIEYIPFERNKFVRLYKFIWLSLKRSWILKPYYLLVVYFNFCFLLGLMAKSKHKVLDIRTGDLSHRKFIRLLKNKMIRIQAIFFQKKIILSESLRKLLRIGAENVLILPLGAELIDSGSHDYRNMNLLYVGTFDSRRISESIKGISIFLKKFPTKNVGIRYKLIGFGSTHEIDEIKSTIENLHLEEIVSLEGRKNHSQLHYYFSWANVGVSYVPINEAFNVQPPTKIYEYAINGLFTIATATDESKLIIKESNGILCDDSAESFADALEECQIKLPLINESAVRESLSENSWVKLVNNKLIPFLN